MADNPNLIWCPQPDCETVCYVKSNSRRKSLRRLFHLLSKTAPNKKKEFVTCSTCNYTFCLDCKSSKQQHNSHCSDTEPASSPELESQTESLKFSVEDDPVTFLEHQGRVKRCPFCKV